MAEVVNPGEVVALGEVVRLERMRQGLSQAEVARIARVSKGRIEALENGRAADMGMRALTSILSVLKLELRLHRDNTRGGS